jgi:prepilin-type processing-associated H-X9-DG protein
VRWGEITDGTSNTLFMSEALLGSNFDTMGSTPGSPRQVASPQGLSVLSTGGTNPALSDAICVGTQRWVGDRGLSWIYGLAQSTTFNTYHLPNSPTPDCHTNGQGRFKAASAHIGGVNVALCDGSVRFVSNSIDLSSWRALSTRAGKEIVGDY